MNRDYETLDAIVVTASLVMVSGLVAGLIFVEIEQDVLPILSSLGTAILGLPVAYGAFRWGNNVGSKQAAEAAADTSKTATSALAQIAGAGPPPPAEPMKADPEPEPKP